MFEKILQKLKTQRGENSNVSDRSLEDLSKSLESLIINDEILDKIDMALAIKSIDGNINHYTSEAVKSIKSQEDNVVAKAKDAQDKKKVEQIHQNSGDKIPDWAKKLIEQNEAVTNTLAALQSEKTLSLRKDQLNKTFITKDGNELPEFYTTPIMKAFERTRFETDDEFNDYLKSIISNNEIFGQKIKEQKITFGSPRRDVDIVEDTGETPILKDARSVIAKNKNNN